MLISVKSHTFMQQTHLSKELAILIQAPWTQGIYSFKTTSTRSKQRLSLCQRTNQEFLSFKSQRVRLQAQADHLSSEDQEQLWMINHHTLFKPAGTDFDVKIM